MSPGTLTSFLLYTVYIATGLSVLSGLISEWMQAIGASTRMFELLDREPAIPLHSTKEQPQSPVALQGHVALENVSFAYPSRSDVQVLKDFSLVVRPNTTVALVGQRCVHACVGGSGWISVDVERVNHTSTDRHKPADSQSP